MICLTDDVDHDGDCRGRHDDAQSYHPHSVISEIPTDVCELATGRRSAQMLGPGGEIVLGVSTCFSDIVTAEFLKDELRQGQPHHRFDR